jgi:Tol biopolymer transport system component
MDVQGGNTTPLTEHGSVLAGMASVSPDGNWIAFAGQKNNGQVYDQNENVIWLVGGKGGDLRTLETPPLQGRAPVWSPDGKRLAFESDRGSAEGHYAVFLINRDGTGLTQVTDYALDATHPVFSPDGRQLVFAYGNPAGKNGIAIVDLP